MRFLTRAGNRVAPVPLSFVRERCAAVDRLDGEGCVVEAVGQFGGGVQRAGDVTDGELADTLVHGRHEQPTGPQRAPGLTKCEQQLVARQVLEYVERDE